MKINPLDRKIRNLQRWQFAKLLRCILICLSCVPLSDAYAAVEQGNDAGRSNSEPRTELRFPTQPTDLDIFNARVFDEPLIPAKFEQTAEDNSALADALAGYANRTNLDDFSSLTTFLERFPASRWQASLLLHLGAEYYNLGYYSRALEAWREAWRSFKTATDPRTKTQADRALGELARMCSKLGRMDELRPLLVEAGARNLDGPGTSLIHGARQGLWMMDHEPGVSFRCGPLALSQILLQKDPNEVGNLLIAESRSTTNGFSLSQVAKLSRDLGINYQMAFRSADAPLVTPAVIHWKVGHYGALLQRAKDRYLVKDFTFRSSLWITPTALASESSGYFLIPPGPLPRGWRSVPEVEGQEVTGKGFVSNQDPNPGPCDPGAGGGGGGGGGCGMPTYGMYLMLASLGLQDVPLAYDPPVGPPIYFQAFYHSLAANQPATFYYSNLGPKWTCNWIAYVVDNPTSPNADVLVYDFGGGGYPFTFNTNTLTYDRQLMTQDQLLRISSSTYELRLRDGSKRLFEQSDGNLGTTRRVFLTKVVDPAGNYVQLRYDSSLRITNVVDAIGQVTTLLYTNAVFPFAITAVRDPFGRAAYLQYSTNGLLSSITDVLGMTSRFAYGTNDFINALVTPYGTTTFAGGQTNDVTWVQATDPLGESELLKFDQNTDLPESDPPSKVPLGMAVFNAYLNARNSFYWDKRAFSAGAGDITKARIYHFLHKSDITTESRVLESVKPPLENRIWLNYRGQSEGYANLNGSSIEGSSSFPSVVGRVLDDGTSQVRYFHYDNFGNITNYTDPVGRNFTFVYDSNGVDRLEVRMTRNGANQLIEHNIYNSQHRLTSITDAAGQTTTNTYNSHGQLTRTTNSRGESTTLLYDTNGYLLSVTGPLQNTNDVTSFTYDVFGRLRTITAPDGYSVRWDYDALNRPTVMTYPDGTYEQVTYDRLDPVALRDRLGRTTHFTYDSLRRLVTVQDPLNRVTRFSWCSCGDLTSITDPMGRMTTWQHDVQGRVVGKQYADGSKIAYNYGNATSRLKSVMDEKGQFIVYDYYSDDNLMRVSYPGAINPTPTVVWSYDSNYSRLISMQDGIGMTTWSYHPVGAPGALRLAASSGPWANTDVTYQYDALGQVTSDSIAGIVETRAYDALGRLTNVVNALGSFMYAYDGAMPRLVDAYYPNGQRCHYDYFDSSGDHRVQRITHAKADTSLISRFTYGYDPMGKITNWIQELGAITNTWRVGYDAADQLLSVLQNLGSPNSVAYTYGYDLAGNRLYENSNSVSRAFTYNALNQLVSGSAGSTNGTIYEWDAENRLIAATLGPKRSEFSYDGFGRRVRVVEKVNAVVLTNYTFLWVGPEICEQRDSSGEAAVRRFYPQGETVVAGMSAAKYYYTRDHLGSIRETLDSNAFVATRYTYDPFGRRGVILENIETTFGFSGHLAHTASGLDLTWYRALNPELGRWISRDPLGERSGLNLYAYVLNDPINRIDSRGLSCGAGGGGGGGGGGDNSTLGIKVGAALGGASKALGYLGEAAAAEVVGAFGFTFGIGYFLSQLQAFDIVPAPPDPGENTQWSTPTPSTFPELPGSEGDMAGGTPLQSGESCPR